MTKTIVKSHNKMQNNRQHKGMQKPTRKRAKRLQNNQFKRGLMSVKSIK